VPAPADTTATDVLCLVYQRSVCSSHAGGLHRCNNEAPDEWPALLVVLPGLFVVLHMCAQLQGPATVAGVAVVYHTHVLRKRAVLYETLLELVRLARDSTACMRSK
jgi:hypothetical protein